MLSMEWKNHSKKQNQGAKQQRNKNYGLILPTDHLINALAEQPTGTCKVIECVHTTDCTNLFCTESSGASCIETL